MNLTFLPSSQAHRWERIWMLARIEFKLRYYENKLGLLWALIKPVMQILMYYMVFQVLLNQRVPNYAIYLWCGLLMWQFFTECTSGTIKVLQSKKYLYTYTDMPKLDIYISSMMSTSIGLLINLAIFFFGALVAGIYPTYHYIYFFLIYINLFMLSFGMALILSNLFVLFKDINQIWGIVTSFGFFLSPILYRGELFDEKLPWLNYANPISGVITNTRNILMFGQNPHWDLLLFDLAYALLILLAGLWLLKSLGPKAGELV